MDSAPPNGVFSLVYLSRAPLPLDAQTIDDIAITSALTNASIDVTGYLTYSEPRFVQYLEGPRDAVTGLLEKIELDQRHDMTRVVELGDSERRFPDWSMHLLGPLSHAAGGPIETMFELLSMSSKGSSDDELLAESLRDLANKISDGQ